MLKLQFDAARYCRHNAGRMGKWMDGEDIAGMIADEVENLRALNDTLRKESEFYRAQCDMRDKHRDELEAGLAALKDAAIHIYNSGYHAGHHATVEGGYVDIHSSDMNTYHAEEVAELLTALVGEE